LSAPGNTHPRGEGDAAAGFDLPFGTLTKFDHQIANLALKPPGPHAYC
jgi:hypothetical protein